MIQDISTVFWIDPGLLCFKPFRNLVNSILSESEYIVIQHCKDNLQICIRMLFKEIGASLYCLPPCFVLWIAENAC